MNQDQPLVSVICLCHNHRPYVEACLESVATQTYHHIELIIVDDGSVDDSKLIIEQTIARWGRRLPLDPVFLSLSPGVGNCRAFNQAFAISSGTFVIDLAADDLLMSDRVRQQVVFFEQLPEDVGVIYGDAEYIDEDGQSLERHRVVRPINGDVYREVLSRYFIPPPTMMMRRSILEQLEGYDERLAYEDFDFWVRSARICHYAYQPKALTAIRRVPGSLSTRFYEEGSPLAYSTYLVCEKAYGLNQSEEDNKALLARIRYERRQCALLGNRAVARQFGVLQDKVGNRRWSDFWVDVLIALPWNWGWLLRIRHRLRHLGHPAG